MEESLVVIIKLKIKNIQEKKIIVRGYIALLAL